MKKILVVDDDPTVVSMMKTKLERDGKYAVVEGHNGKDALDIAEREQPDVVLCDIDMPNMDGGAVASALEKNKATHGIPIIFLSAMVTPADVKAGGGKWPMLSKASPLNDLIDAIEKSRRS
jgi:CheY-like chemotaxis protein